MTFKIEDVDDIAYGQLLLRNISFTYCMKKLKKDYKLQPKKKKDGVQ